MNCTASGGAGPEEYRRIYREGNQNLIAWLAGSPLKKFVYTSSTSVYGQNDGSIVTESIETSCMILASRGPACQYTGRN